MPPVWHVLDSTRCDHVSVKATGRFYKGLRYRVKLGQNRTPTWQIPSVRIEEHRMRTRKIPCVRTDIKLRQSGRFHLLESYIGRIQKILGRPDTSAALFSFHFFSILYTFFFFFFFFFFSWRKKYGTYFELFFSFYVNFFVFLKKCFNY